MVTLIVHCGPDTYMEESYGEDQPRYSAVDHAIRDARTYMKSGVWSSARVKKNGKTVAMFIG